MTNSSVKLSQFSPGTCCGYKLFPADLCDIKKQVPNQSRFDRLLVGCESRNDAAVYDLGNGITLIGTTDFFTPIMNDQYDLERIAAVNTASDNYAMGSETTSQMTINRAH